MHSICFAVSLLAGTAVQGSQPKDTPRLYRVILPMGEIATRPWGERSFYMVDPSGNPLCFVDEKTIFTGRQSP